MGESEGGVSAGAEQPRRDAGAAGRDGAAREARVVRRIVLSGTESTGKTQLAQRLAAHFGEPWSAEYAREY